MSITVYTKPRCVQCDATKRSLEKSGMDFTQIDLVDNPAALEYVKELGFTQAPVVVVEEGNATDAWAGFRPDKIKALGQQVAAVAV